MSTVSGSVCYIGVKALQWGWPRVAFSWWNQQPASLPAVVGTLTTSLRMACRRLYLTTVRPAQQLQTTPHCPPSLTHFISSPTSSNVTSSTLMMHDKKGYYNNNSNNGLQQNWPWPNATGLWLDFMVLPLASVPIFWPHLMSLICGGWSWSGLDGLWKPSCFLLEVKCWVAIPMVHRCCTYVYVAKNCLLCI